MPRHFAALIDLSQHKTDAAAVRLGRLNQRAGESDHKRGVLAGYRDEYRARLAEATRRGAGALEIRNFRAFLERLDEAVAQQEREAAHWREQVGVARGAWMGERRSLAAFSTIAERRHLLEARSAARREQKQQDEFAARARPALGH